MSDDDGKIIDFIERQADRENAQWERACEQLHACIVDAANHIDESITGVALATLNALLDVMQQSGMSLDEAKAFLISRIKMFR